MAKGPAGYCSIVCVTFPQGGVLSWRGMAAAGLLAAGPAGLGGAVGVEDEPPASSVNTDITVELTHQGAILRRGLTAVFLVAQVVQPFPVPSSSRGNFTLHHELDHRSAGRDTPARYMSGYRLAGAVVHE